MTRTIEKIVEFAKKAIEPERIILFGSMASGKVDAYSDLDLLIVVKDSAMKRSYAERVENYSRELSLHADVLIYDERELEEASKKKNSFIDAIVKSGKVMYESGIEKSKRQ